MSGWTHEPHRLRRLGWRRLAFVAASPALAALLLCAGRYAAGSASPAPTLRLLAGAWPAVHTSTWACVGAGRPGLRQGVVENRTGGSARGPVVRLHRGPGEDTPTWKFHCCPKDLDPPQLEGTRDSAGRPRLCRTRCSCTRPGWPSSRRRRRREPHAAASAGQRRTPLRLQQPQRVRHGWRLSTVPRINHPSHSRRADAVAAGCLGLYAEQEQSESLLDGSRLPWLASA